MCVKFAKIPVLMVTRLALDCDDDSFLSCNAKISYEKDCTNRRMAASSGVIQRRVMLLGSIAVILVAFAYWTAAAGGGDEPVAVHASRRLKSRSKGGSEKKGDLDGDVDGDGCNGPQDETRPCNMQVCGGGLKSRDCVWGGWEEWQRCDCTGTQQRFRNVTQDAANGGLLCVGPERQIHACQAPSCGGSERVDCQLGAWETWSDCTRTCQGGQQYRTRDVVTQMLGGGALCNANLREAQVCNPIDCPGSAKVGCRWGDWGEWSTCSQTCGGGQTGRSRSIEVAPKFGGKLCDPVDSSEIKQCPEAKSCNGTDLDCKWSTWSLWADCSVSCGGGTKLRMRNIAQEVQVGGAGCEGDFQDYDICGTKTCNLTDQGQDCYLGLWSNWTLCSSKCNGHYSRTRMIQIPEKDGGQPCQGSTMDIKACNTDAKDCAIENTNCTFSDWGAWSACSQSCEGGSSSRKRELEKHAQGYGAQCEGELTMIRQCAPQPCPGQEPVDCTWSPWSDWSRCTKSCGGGEYRRHRAVSTDAANGGRPCSSGAGIEIGVCEQQACPKVAQTCEWSSWGSWSDCLRGGQKVTCGGGQRKRTRGSVLVDEDVRTKVDAADARSSAIGAVPFLDSNKSRLRRLAFSLPFLAPSPAIKPTTTTTTLSIEIDKHTTTPLPDMSCRELEDEEEPCAQAQCGKVEPANCVWGVWSQWSACPCSGVQERHRVIASYAKGGGAQCEGSEVQANPCHADCDAGPAVDCKMSSWTPWSVCPVTCGGGQGDGFLKRYRVVIKNPQGSGQTCSGNTTEMKPCNPAPCPDPIDCSWGIWTEWSACSAKCGGGEKSRTRNIEEVAQNGGHQCQHSDSMVVESCNMQSCPSQSRDCEFSAWNDWATCTKSCGSGHQHRSRMIMVEATIGGIDCDGYLQEFQRCSTQECPGKPKINCQWGLWSEWSACSQLCNGHNERNRAIMQFARNGGQPCKGPERDIDSCNVNGTSCQSDAPRDCTLTSWTDWTLCSKPCDGGQKYRSREIQVPARNFGRPCTGNLRTSTGCNTQTCPGNQKIDCKWGDWGAWSACSKTCLGGQHVRHREIAVEPSPSGLPCAAGAAMETGACNIGPCFSIAQVCGWDQWSLWGPCSKECGGGQQERFRQQQWVPADAGSAVGARRLLGYGGYDVPGISGSRGDCSGTQKSIRPCGVAPCSSASAPIACRFEDWSDWTDCSCSGLRERSRNVAAGPKNGGLFCSGPTRGSQTCTPQSCGWDLSSDCKFGSWSPWSECDVTCGGGQRYHTRTILNHSKGYGFGCQGGLDEVAECGKQPCGQPVDCMYSMWSAWTACTRACGGGEHTRSRSMKTAAAFGGAKCEQASLMELGQCNTDPCKQSIPVDCRWTLWDRWTLCSATCGKGTMSRKRQVAVEPANAGDPCSGSFQQYKPCVLGPCVQEVSDCKFSAWSSWSSCSQRCGGHQERVRNIKVYARGLGKACEGASQQIRPCNGGGATVCAEQVGIRDCELGVWSAWSACTRSCGGGQKETYRQVAVHAQGGGKPCGEASLKKVRPCSEKSCPGQEPQDCSWTEWGPLSRCSASCGGGQQYRHREVGIGAKNGGKQCEQSDTLQVLPCGTQPCSLVQTTCVWSPWSNWDACTAPCGGGQMKRHRMLVNASLLPRSKSKLANAREALTGDWGFLNAHPAGDAVGISAKGLVGPGYMGAVAMAALLVLGAAMLALRGSGRSSAVIGVQASSYTPVATEEPGIQAAGPAE